MKEKKINWRWTEKPTIIDASTEAKVAPHHSSAWERNEVLIMELQDLIELLD